MIDGRQIHYFRLKVVLILIFIFTLHSFCSTAASFTSRDLIENSKLLDGKLLTYRGEVIAAIMGRGDYSWVNVYDGYNAIGVWCKTSLLKDIHFLGDYKCRGDVVEVEGVFSRACSAHGGELDIHGIKITVIERGFRKEERIDKRRIGLAVALFALTLLMVSVFRKRL
ncbi:MAG: DNA-binding protein [Candidatus Omnitrophica bacterium]|nr:DNA-binding protein [Candidatus Omnitrophota bacterium]MCM8790716.1 DNA-binding protein [Candidatus Omnitrophota bacterium]